MLEPTYENVPLAKGYILAIEEETGRYFCLSEGESLEKRKLMLSELLQVPLKHSIESFREDERIMVFHADEAKIIEQRRWR